MNNRLRRSAYLRSFFVLCAAAVIRSDALEELTAKQKRCKLKAAQAILSCLILHLLIFNLQLPLMLLQLRTTFYNYQEVW